VLLGEATASFDDFDYARVLQRTEEYFWRYCDDYLELVKMRAYGGDDRASTDSARATLGLALSVLLRLLAPFLCFATEESWRWWHDSSIHRASWPTPDELDVAVSLPGVFDAASDVLAAVRKTKSAAKRSMRTSVERVTVTGSPERLAAVEAARRDLMDAGVIERLELAAGDDDVTVVLADEAQSD